MLPPKPGPKFLRVVKLMRVVHWHMLSGLCLETPYAKTIYSFVYTGNCTAWLRGSAPWRAEDGHCDTSIDAHGFTSRGRVHGSKPYNMAR